MTEKTYQREPDGSLKKMDGWFSWRHKTREAHDAAREKYLSRRGPTSRREGAADRVSAYPAGLSHSATRGHLLGRCSCKAVAA